MVVIAMIQFLMTAFFVVIIFAIRVSINEAREAARQSRRNRRRL